MNSNSIFSPSENSQMESSVKHVLGLLTDLDFLYGTASTARQKQESLQSNIKRYESLKSQWNGQAKRPNIVATLGYGLLWAVISFVALIIAYLFVGFLFLWIFGEDLIDFIFIGTSVVMGIYNMKSYYSDKQSDYDFYISTDINALNRQYQDLNKPVQEYNMKSQSIYYNLPPYINDHYFAVCKSKSIDWFDNHCYGDLRNFLNKYIRQFGYNFNAWFIAMENEKQTRQIMRANANMHDQQMREAYRMRSLAEEGLKNQQEQTAYAQRQAQAEQEQVEYAKRQVEIEQQKLYELKKIREEMID